MIRQSRVSILPTAQYFGVADSPGAKAAPSRKEAARRRPPRTTLTVHFFEVLSDQFFIILDFVIIVVCVSTIVLFLSRWSIQGASSPERKLAPGQPHP
ncbi:hypothetical protein Zmor_023405 [Zophobas morio]|uniref:Uncharacterized protein n=1 Tax=Zophobas morio TaxID=2755281 RepID=A0AA38M7T9_9CUCU|nr:hypothetical protein Zmor_023405 [Zophobas morio]